MAYSSNVGAIKAGLRLGPERFTRYVRAFGFGGPLSPDFRGENPGIVWDAAALTDSALASTLIGYQVGVTPLQMATAVSAVANGGEVLQPRVVRAVTRDGVRTEVEKKVLRRAISQRTAAQLLPMLEAVVSKGTAKVAQMDGYTVAGKTGTAKKLVNGSYRGHSDYNASFVGFVPSRTPRFTIVVVVDSPHQRVGLRRRRGGADLQAHQRGDAAVRGRATDHQPGSAGRRGARGRAPAAVDARRARRSADRTGSVTPAHQPRRRAGRRRLERPRGAAHAGRGGPDAARAWRRLRGGAGSRGGHAAPQRPHRGAVAWPPTACGSGGPRHAMTVGALLQQALAGLASAGDLEHAARLTGPCSGVAYDSRSRRARRRCSWR